MPAADLISPFGALRIRGSTDGFLRYFDQLERLLDEQLDRTTTGDRRGPRGGLPGLSAEVGGTHDSRGVNRRAEPSGSPVPGRSWLRGRFPAILSRTKAHLAGRFAAIGTPILPDAIDSGSHVAENKEPSGQGRRLPTIAGFQIVREIGQGGMGVVYEAIELALGRRAALKILLTQRASATSIERFPS